MIYFVTQSLTHFLPLSNLYSYLLSPFFWFVRPAVISLPTSSFPLFPLYLCLFPSFSGPSFFLFFFAIVTRYDTKTHNKKHIQKSYSAIYGESSLQIQISFKICRYMITATFYVNSKKLRYSSV